MGQKQLTALVAVAIVGFAAVAALGWVSDRVAQESNRRAVERLRDDLEAAVTAINSQAIQVQAEIREQGAAQRSSDTDLSELLAEAIYDSAGLVGETISDTAFAVEQLRAAAALRLNTKVVEAVNDVRSQVTLTPPRSFCSGLRSRQTETADRYKDARNVWIQQIMQSRLSSIALLSAVLQCDYLLYP